MAKIGLLLCLLGILLIELSPGSLRLAELLEDTLVRLLLAKVGILVNLLVLIHEACIDLLESLGIAQSRVQHLLVVPDKGHLAREPLIPVVLRPGIHVVLLLKGRGVRLIPPSVVVDLRVLPQVVVECSFLVRRLVYRLQATRAVRDIGIPAAAIIGVADGLGVDVGQWLGRSLSLDHERTCGKKEIIR